MSRTKTRIRRTPKPAPASAVDMRKHLPGTDIPFTALTPCAQGATHTTPITTRRELVAAVHAAAACTQLHGRPRTLTLAQAATTTADTQALDVTGLRADNDQTPKEHPQP